MILQLPPEKLEKSGPGATVVNVGTIAIPPGRTGVTYEKPVTNLRTAETNYVILHH